jgi:hypothetical protein
MMRAHRLPFPSGWGARAAAASSLLLGLTLAISNLRAFPVYGDQTVLPAGTELNEDALDRPREIFNSVSSRSYEGVDSGQRSCRVKSLNTDSGGKHASCSPPC